MVARLGELPAGSVRTFRFQTRSTPAAGGELKVRALAMFDSPAKSGLRSAAGRIDSCRAAPRSYGRSQFTFTPRFDVLKTELLPSDEHALRSLIDSWRGAREISIRAVGHADSQPISGRNRKVFADNYALSEARAPHGGQVSRRRAQRVPRRACTSRATAPTSRSRPARMRPASPPTAASTS